MTTPGPPCRLRPWSWRAGVLLLLTLSSGGMAACTSGLGPTPPIGLPTLAPSPPASSPEATTHPLPPTAPLTQLPGGSWGASELGLEVHPLYAKLYALCWEGTISGTITLDVSGHFAMPGTWLAATGAPRTPTGLDEHRLAQYSGWTDGQTLTLTVTLPDDPQGVSSYRLQRGYSTRPACP